MTAQEPAPPGQPDPSTHLMNLALGMWWSRAIYVAAELGIADHLIGGPRDVDGLAALTGTHAPSLYRLLRFLTGLGIFVEVGPRVFAQSDLSALLRSGVSGSRLDEVLMLGGEWHWQAWGMLGHTVRTGQTAIDHLFGEDLFAYFAHQNQKAGEIFHRMLTAEPQAPVCGAYDFSGIGTLVDVGGGHGGLLTAVVHAHPGIRGILFDRPDVIENVRARSAELGLDERIELMSGDFFEAVPPADAYLLRNIIHDWSDEEGATILGNCRAALHPGGRILVIEQVVPEWNEWSSIKFGDLDMMVLVHGRERTTAEFHALFDAARFQLHRIIRTASAHHILEGLPR